MNLPESSRCYEFTNEDATDIGALFGDLKRGVEALEWMLSTNAGETLTHHFELCYLLRNIKAAVTSSAGRPLPGAACSLTKSEMYKLLCEGPLLDLTAGVLRPPSPLLSYSVKRANRSALCSKVCRRRRGGSSNSWKSSMMPTTPPLSPGKPQWSRRRAQRSSQAPRKQERAPTARRRTPSWRINPRRRWREKRFPSPSLGGSLFQPTARLRRPRDRGAARR